MDFAASLLGPKPLIYLLSQFDRIAVAFFDEMGVMIIRHARPQAQETAKEIVCGTWGSFVFAHAVKVRKLVITVFSVTIFNQEVIGL